MGPPGTVTRRRKAVREGLVGVGAGGVALLVAATFTTVIGIRVGTTSRLADLDTQLSGWDRHGAALLVLALLAAVMLAGARRGSGPAAAAVAATGVAALAIALVGDAPDVHDTGLVGSLYEDAVARPGAGFAFELVGGALLLGAGLALAALRR
jgi:hypothetical protein